MLIRRHIHSCVQQSHQNLAPRGRCAHRAQQYCHAHTPKQSVRPTPTPDVIAHIQGSYSSHTRMGFCKSPDCPLGNLIVLWELSPSPRIARNCSWILCPGWVRTWPCQSPILGNMPSKLVLTREWKEARLGAGSWGGGCNGEREGGSRDKC